MRGDPMDTRTLGRQGLVVSEIGLGCMSMTGGYGTPNEQEALATIHRALDLGVNFLDTADMYGNAANEELRGRRAVRQPCDASLLRPPSRPHRPTSTGSTGIPPLRRRRVPWRSWSVRTR